MNLSTSFYFLVLTAEGLEVKYFSQSAEATKASHLDEALRMSKACGVTFKELL